MYQTKRQNIRAMLAGSVAVIAIAGSAHAQDASETVTVSSSRIINAGFNAPTPTTVMGSDFIESQAKDTIFTAVTQLPSMLGSTGVESGVNGTSGGTNGLASFNMFGLGTIRTLTLLDGQRFMPANVTGVPDISEFPQMLIQRVDVVTGGASASWGSDAIAGVVNFITNKKFEGFKANISSGLSTYADNGTVNVQMAAGTSFAGGRGHFEVSAEYMHMDGVEGGWSQLACCGGRLDGSLSNGRTWFISPTTLAFTSPGAAITGVPGAPNQPQYTNTSYGTQNRLGRYGLIGSGPLQGIAFGPNNTTYRFNYGIGPNGLQGVPAGGGNAFTPGAVTNCVVQFCVGGELDGITGSGVTLATPLTRGNVYTRLSYDITPNTNIYATVSWAQVGTSNIPNPDMWLDTLPGITGGSGQAFTLNNVVQTGFINSILTNQTFSNSTFNPGQLLQAPGIQCGNAPGGGNAFLNANGINQACANSGVTSFSFGSLYYGLGPQKVYTMRNNRRYVLGGEGAFNLFDTDINWNAYFQHGENDTNIHVRNIALKPYMYAAIDSVLDAQGVAVCRSAAARSLGCVPFNPFGGTISQAQKDWIYGGTKWGPGPMQISRQKQNVADFVFSGSPLSNWAGAIQVATGGTWREEEYKVRGDGAGNGTIGGAGGAPGSACVDPLLNCLNGTNWYAGSFHNANGYYYVMEGFVEVNVPLLDTPEWGKADLSVSGRHAHYSTAGAANTWKVGLTWDTPLDGLRLRALQSRDLRAPNLSELFAAPVTANGSSNDPWRTGNIQVIQGTYGNPLLKPEKSINSQIGVVWQPSWVPGLSTSVDYYWIGLGGQITTVSQAQSINNCYQATNFGQTALLSYCDNIVVQGGASPANSASWIQVNSQFYNTATTHTDGFNVEVSYQFDLADTVLEIPGSFTFRNLATYVTKFVTTPGIPGTFSVNSAGANDGAVPHLKVFATQQYQGEGWEFHLSENWISEGRHNNNYVQCNPGSCPLGTNQNPTINDNHSPGIYYLNAGGSIDIDDHWTVYGQVDNLLDKDPPPLYSMNQNPTNDGANPLLYDTIGRMFHVGVRVQN